MSFSDLEDEDGEEEGGGASRTKETGTKVRGEAGAGGGGAGGDSAGPEGTGGGRQEGWVDVEARTGSSSGSDKAEWQNVDSDDVASN